MAFRDVVLRYDVFDATADTTYELWLKRDTDPWQLFAVGPAEYVAATQDFTLQRLDEGTAYQARVRQRRAGRYRAGYEGVSPDSWPAESLLTFTTGTFP